MRIKQCLDCNREFTNMKKFSNHTRYGCHYSIKYLRDKRIAREKKKIASYKRLSKNRMGENNPNWGGDYITLPKLHEWVRRRLKEPGNCPGCNVESKLDLVNISNKYNKETYTRDLKNWKYLCRRCHMREDGRLDRLHEFRRIQLCV